jgi:molybdenum cofactor cytidylyltransferase
MLAAYSRASRNVAIILLAAGASTRMGTPKQLLQYRNRSLIRYLTEIALASDATSLCVVLGAESARVQQELADLSATLLENPRWAEGMSSSVRAGLAWVPASVHAAIIMLCDQPLVSTGLLDSMINAYVSSGKPIVACEYAGTLGVPALFDRSLFPDLSNLTGDRGAKQIVTQHHGDVYRIPFPGGTVDLDTPSDFKHFTS